MRRPPSHSLLGPALVLYMLADAAAAQGQLDALGAVSAVVCGLLSMTALRSTHALEDAGSRRVGWLGLALAGVLLRGVAPRALALAVDVSSVVSAACAAALLVDLAVTVPDSLFTQRSERSVRVAAWLFALASAAAGVYAVAPPVRLLGTVWIAPAWYVHVADAGLAAALVFALVARILRGRAGSSAEIRASNSWALFGVAPAAGLGILLATARLFGLPASSPSVRAGLLALGAVLVWGHLRSLDPGRRAGIGAATRSIIPAAATLVLVAGCSLLLRPYWPRAALLQAAAVTAGALLAFVIHRALREYADNALAPSAARLLRALERAHLELNRATGLDQVARVALGAARRACGDPNAEPLLYLFNPVLALRLDAAGFPHEGAVAPHSELMRALRADPRRILLRGAITAQAVRVPAQRALSDVLAGLDAACVLPLLQQGELEGALVVPRGARRADPNLEELDALRRFGEQLSAFVSLLSAEARAQRRASEAQAANARTQNELDHTRAALLRAEVEARVLHAGGALPASPRAEVAYSAAMRALLEKLRILAGDDGPVLLWSEPGVPLTNLMRQLHAGSPRAQRRFVLGDCASLPGATAASILNGSAQQPGWIQIAGDGTLALNDLNALPADLQRELVAICAPPPPQDAQPAAVPGPRLIATCRSDPRRIAAEGALEPALLARFTSVRVPALRERAADLHSLVLLALDRSARILGRPPVGVSPEAEACLRAYDWPGNQDELDNVVVRAVARCRSQRVALDDLPVLRPAAIPAAAAGADPADETLEAIEKRALSRALERCAGNKSEAARMLGLKRSTFLDKLRRHGLDGSPAAVPN